MIGDIIALKDLAERRITKRAGFDPRELKMETNADCECGHFIEDHAWFPHFPDPNSILVCGRCDCNNFSAI